MIIFFSKLKFISILFLVSFIFSKQSYSNELDKISACAGVVMGDGATELRDLQNESNFDNAFELAIKAFYGEGLSNPRSKEDITIAESILASNVDKIYTQPEWTAEVYEEVQQHSDLAARVHKAFVKARKEIGAWTNLSDSPYISQRNRALGIS